jgi:hypothetical protein
MGNIKGVRGTRRAKYWQIHHGAPLLRAESSQFNPEAATKSWALPFEIETYGNFASAELGNVIVAELHYLWLPEPR